MNSSLVAADVGHLLFGEVIGIQTKFVLKEFGKRRNHFFSFLYSPGGSVGLTVWLQFAGGTNATEKQTKLRKNVCAARKILT